MRAGSRSTRAGAGRLVHVVKGHLGNPQHQTTYYLTANNLIGAAAGFAFWLLFARVADLDAAALGIGYAVVALGTVVGVLAKGGLDTALLRAVPGTSRTGGRRLFALAVGVGTGIGILVTFSIAAIVAARGSLPGLHAVGWLLVAAIGILLLVTWLYDAYFVALGRADFSLRRNLVLAVSRLALPIPLVWIAATYAVSLTWALALGASALASVWLARRMPERAGPRAGRREFLGNAMRNVSGSAAEFLPGLLLVPLVLAVEGAAAAAFFGIAWTAAALIFQTSAAIGRSALAALVVQGPAGRAAAIRKGALQHVWLVAPMALVAALLSFPLMGLFGPEYARNGSHVLTILAASILVVAPTSLYMAVLRSRRRSLTLVFFPIAMILTLVLLVPTLASLYGITGVAWAWMLANAPFALFATWRLHSESREVMHRDDTPTLVRRAELE